MWPFTPEDRKEQIYRSEEKHRRSERDHWCRQNGIGYVNNFLTAFGVAIGTVAAGGAVFAAIYAHGAYIAARDQVTEARKQTVSASMQAIEAHNQTEIQKGLERVYIIADFKEPIFQDNWKGSIGSATFSLDGMLGNFGRVPAVIRSGSIWVYLNDSIPTQPVYAILNVDNLNNPAVFYPGPFPSGKIKEQVLIPGSTIAIHGALGTRENDAPDALPRVPDRALHLDVIGDLWTGSLFFFVYGIVSYEDHLGQKREFGFCRRYAVISGTFDQAGGEEYNFDRSVQSKPPIPQQEKAVP